MQLSPSIPIKTLKALKTGDRSALLVPMCDSAEALGSLFCQV